MEAVESRPDAGASAEAPLAGLTPRRWLAGLAIVGQRQIRLTILAGTLAGLATIAQMGLLAWLVHQTVIVEAPLSQLMAVIAALVLMIVLRGALLGLQGRFAADSSRAIRGAVRRQLLAAWQQAGPGRLQGESAATLASEWLDQVEALHGYFARFLPQMMLCVLVPLAILAVAAWLDWLAALLLLFSAPLIPLFMALVGMGAEKVNQQHFQVIGRLSGQFLDKVRALTTLQLFGGIKRATDILAARSEEYRDVTMKTLRVAFLSSAVLEFFSSVAIAVVAIYIGFGLLGYISFGPSDSLTLFSGLWILLLAPEFFQPLRQLAQHYHDRAAALGASAQLMDRLQSAPTANPAHAPVTGPPDRIDLHSVTLRYEDRGPVLNRLSLSLPRGGCVALVGPSGGGKSSLLHVLAGFLPPDGGTVSVFGEAPGHRPFGWLGQSPFLLQGSWADNLRLVAPAATEADMQQALARVGLGDLPGQRAAGLDSPVSEQGSGLSGGQARRLSLARIFLADYPLVLLDEPTAGLDADSQTVIIEALAALKAEGRTLVLATHHDSLLALADRCLHVEGGDVRDV